MAREGRAHKQTDAKGERGARSNTLTVQRLVCTLHDGKGSHPSPRCKTKERGSVKPIIAMDHYFMKMKSATNAQTISEESKTCIAVKEDRRGV